MASTYQYLKPDNLKEVFSTSRQYTEGLTDRFPEFERIARNVPHGSIPKEYPKTTDGTTASYIRKTPHRIIQRLPTGRVKSITEGWLSIVASFIYSKHIIPNANEGYALLQKCWTVIERFLTFGFCATYAPFVEKTGKYCTDLRLVYWGDIFIQPGKLSDADSNYIFLRSWWQESDIEALIESQRKLKPENRTWDIKALKEVKGLYATKDEKAKTPDEKSKNIEKKEVELVTGFQRGVGAKFYTFHPGIGTVVRTKENKDPRGELPVSFAYGDIDGSNPFGRGVVELVLGLQNLMDSEMQMYQYNRALQLGPPLIKRGNFSKNLIKFVPNAIIDVGADPNATVETLKIDTTALTNFPNNYGLMQSQLFGLLSAPSSQIPASAGSITQSKTPQGVEQNKANLSIDDNYVRRLFETWFSRWSETAINIYFAERTGIEDLQLDDESAAELRALENFDQALLTDDNKIRIDYSSATPALEFRIDASSSQQKDDETQSAVANDLLGLVMKYPSLNSAWGGPIDVDELARKIVISSSIDNPGLIAPEPTTEQKKAKLESRGKPNSNSPMFDKPKLDINYPDLPASAQQQLLALAGINVPIEDVMEGPPLNQNIDRNVKAEGTQSDSQGTTPEHVLKANEMAHTQAMDVARHQLDSKKLDHQVNMDNAKHGLETRTQIDNSKEVVTEPTTDTGVSQPAEATTPSPNSEQDQQMIYILTKLGASEQQIQQALAMLHAGKTPQEIIEMLQGANNG